MSELMQGLNISIWGLGLTFLSIGLLVLLIIGMDKLFPAKPEAEEAPEEAGPAIEMTVEEDESEVAAAILVALQKLQQESAAGYEGLGAELQSGHGAWWSVRRYPQTPARADVQQRRS